MFNLERFLYTMYVNKFEDNSDMFTAISLAAEYLAKEEYTIRPDDAKLLEIASKDGSGTMVAKFTHKSGVTVLVKIEEYSVIARGPSFLIDFSTGEMRMPTFDGYVYLPSFGDEKAMYFSKGSVAYFEAVLSEPFASQAVPSERIDELIKYIEPDDSLPIEELSPYGIVFKNVIDYTESKKTFELEKLHKDNPQV